MFNGFYGLLGAAMYSAEPIWLQVQQVYGFCSLVCPHVVFITRLVRKGFMTTERGQKMIKRGLWKFRIYAM